MNKTIPSSYLKKIQDRTFVCFLKGLIPRYFQYCQHEKARRIARKRGSVIGENTVLPITLARKSNKNLTVGHNTTIENDAKIDLRSPVTIGSYCIIGKCEIITTSHFVDLPEWEHKYYGIEIDDYAWLTNRVLVTPACRKIGYGAVCAAGSVVVKDVEPMSIVGGNPAKHLRYRKEVHNELLVESLLSGDLKAYIFAWTNKNGTKE